MNGTDTFFYTWLSQLSRIAALNDEVQSLKDKLAKQDDWDDKDDMNAASAAQLQEEIKEKQQEIEKIKDAAGQNKNALINEVRAAKDQSLIIHPKETSGGLTPKSYHLYLKGDDLEYVTM